ncbi:hypothetical protein NBRC111894_3033 [Sporolactobacillus inulinus]|uniref:Uncharacterized protein n=1 Tax=Sporolactobacillus inulinus TaxID=2078 RepID=A0A4Y1ZEP9_9BACL|nr:hypothetical protein NBRC111894_3033 [Sporolactobacillus inulinus]
MAKKFASIKIPLTSPGGINLRRIIRLFEVLKKVAAVLIFPKAAQPSQ